MRKIVYLSIIFLIFSFCSGNSDNDFTQPTSPPEPPQVQPPSPPEPPQVQPPSPPEPPQGQAQPPQGQGQPPQGQGQPPQKFTEEDRENAINIVFNASQELNDCFESGFGKIYEEILKGYIPDDYEVGVILTCNSNPNAYGSNQAQPPQGQGQPPKGQGQPTEGQDPKRQNEGYYDLKVTLNDSSYTKATASSNTTFGQTESADIILSDFGFNTTGGPLKFNHPVSVASDGNRLVVVDRFNNRALIWNSIPNSNTPPDIVLGQNNFYTEMEGTGLNNLNFPGQASVTPDGKLLIADSNNNRILVWTTFPTSSGQAANYSIDIDAAGGMRGTWPWGVWSDGTKVIVSQTVGGQILLWNNFPGSGNNSPDVIINSSQVGTPRSVTSNGQYIMIGDENANGECTGSHGTRSTHIWTSWPTTNRNPDACIDNWISSAIVDNKIYGIQAGGESLMFFDSLPASNQKKDVASSSMIFASPGSGHRWQGGDDGGVVYAGGKLFVGEYNRNHISVFDSLPDSPNVHPDWSLGSTSPTDFPILDDSIIQNPVIASNGEMLFVSSDFDRSLSVWKNLPGSSSAKPDIFYRRFENAPWDITVYENSVFLAGKRGIYGWNNFDGSGELPDIHNWESIGSINFQELFGIAYNGTYFAIAEGTGEKIYIWEGIPSKSDEPVKTLINPVGVGRLDMNQEWLVVAAYPGDQASVHVIKLDELFTGQLQPITNYRNFPQGVSINEKGFFIALQADNKVIGWTSVEEALSGRPHTMSFGGKDDKSNLGTKMASSVGWDGVHLWVGEFKFSNRLLGFMPSR